MPRKQNLKVFRTPIGFHDAYVAAPSQRAALEAWGSDRNLFAAGGAERVEDPELMREPLANPGKVIRRLRGTAAEQFAALPRNKPRHSAKTVGATSASASKEAKPSPKAKPSPPPKPKPRPDRTPLEAAEAALAEAEQRYRSQRGELARRQAELDRERRSLEREQTRERDKLARRHEAIREKFERAMQAWREKS